MDKTIIRVWKYPSYVQHRRYKQAYRAYSNDDAAFFLPLLFRAGSLRLFRVKGGLGAVFGGCLNFCAEAVRKTPCVALADLDVLVPNAAAYRAEAYGSRSIVSSSPSG